MKCLFRVSTESGYRNGQWGPHWRLVPVIEPVVVTNQWKERLRQHRMSSHRYTQPARPDQMADELLVAKREVARRGGITAMWWSCARYGQQPNGVRYLRGEEVRHLERDRTAHTVPEQDKRAPDGVAQHLN